MLAVGMCISCLQLQTLGPSWKFCIIIFFSLKKNQSRTQDSHIYNFNIFLLPPPPTLPFSCILYNVALETAALINNLIKFLACLYSTAINICGF